MDKPLTKRAQRKAATREAVIEAARIVFHAQGYRAATIEDIARTAKVSPGTVLNAAPTKIALLNEVMVEEFTRLGAECDALRASLTSPFADAVPTILELHLTRHFDALPLVGALVGHAWIDGDDDLGIFYQHLDLAWGAIRTLVKEQADLGALGEGVEPESVVRLMQDAYLGVLRRSAGGTYDRFSASAALRTAFALILGGARA